MGKSVGLDRSTVPLQVSGVYVQIRELHKRDGWDIGDPLVSERKHKHLQEHQLEYQLRPCALRWMTPLCDVMHNDLSARDRESMDACVSFSTHN